MKIVLPLTCLAILVSSCQESTGTWEGPELVQPRDQLTVEQLLEMPTLPLIDMSFFSRPEWALMATHQFSGAITFIDTEMEFPIERAYYSGENIFPGITLEFISHQGELIPIRKEFMVSDTQTASLWNVIAGTGKVWNEPGDSGWNRASFPLTLTDNYIGQARNCVGTFVYKEDAISNVCIQCSQETADFNEQQVGNMRVLLAAEYQKEKYADSLKVIDKRDRLKSARLPVYPLSEIDREHEIADYFEKQIYTNAPTSLGAIILDDKIYLQSPLTRHGLYPYPNEMRHAVYSVTKSMTGALAMFYLAERYGVEIFDALITDYVPALENHPGWEGVTFSNTLNMVTGTDGGEDGARLYEILIKARSAEESIKNIAGLDDAPAAPGEKFNYASTNLFVLSCAMQNYMEEREGAGVSYWDLIHDNVLVPIGADGFILRRTVEPDGSEGLPLLAYGAWPTLDEAAKIALLISREGMYNGQQLLHREKCREALGRTDWAGINTGNDYRGKHYRHSFWASEFRTGGCKVEVTYMLGYGGNYVWFFPSGVIAIRFMDEYDLEFKDLVKAVERVSSSCHAY